MGQFPPYCHWKTCRHRMSPTDQIHETISPLENPIGSDTNGQNIELTQGEKSHPGGMLGGAEVELEFEDGIVVFEKHNFQRLLWG